MTGRKGFLVRGKTDEGDLLPIRWNDSLSVGDERIDADHRKLIAGVNDICAAVRNGESEVRIKTLMLDLMAAELIHLRRETDILTQAGYPGVAVHEAEHQHIRTEMLALRAKAEEIKGLELVRLSIAIKSAFLNHLNHADRDFRNFLSHGDRSGG